MTSSRLSISATCPRLVTNAILWSAGDEIAPSGSRTGGLVNVDKLRKNQDFEPPKTFDVAKVARDFKLATADATDSSADPRAPENAIAGLSVGEGVEITLAANEPMLRNPTNLDIDDRGRVSTLPDRRPRQPHCLGRRQGTDRRCPK